VGLPPLLLFPTTLKFGWMNPLYELHPS
jgi:hypothetical protein